MNDTNLIDITQAKRPEKKGLRSVKPRIEGVLPTSIVDVWRLVERSLRDSLYPDTTEEQPEEIRSHLFEYLKTPTFAGLLVKIGKRPVGTILGHVQARPFGRPKRFAYLHCFWVDEQFRKQGIGHLLFQEYLARMKNAGVFHWEGLADPKLALSLQKEGGVPVNHFLTVIGGRF